MDAANVSEKQSAMIALLPTTTDWCHIELPHMTLVYAGDITKLKSTDFNEMAKDTAMLAMLSPPIGLRVLSKDRFGPPEELVDVFALQMSSELGAMRRAVESWNTSEFPFSPHVTIGPSGQFVDVTPDFLFFDRLMIAWGEDSLTFWMRR
jgi:2'-5' RNA ligase